MANNKIKAILFDLGDTLLNFGRISSLHIYSNASHWTYDYLKEHAQPVGSKAIYGLVNLIGIRWRYLISHITGNDFDSLVALRTYGDKRGFTLTDEQWEEINWLWYLPLREKTQMEDDIVETLTKLRDMGIKLGVISNTFVNGHALDRHLEQEGIIDFFEPRMYSYQYTFRKPNKRIFLEGAKRIGEEPCNIMYIGDRVDKDVKGSMGAGMVPVLKKAYTSEGKKIPAGTIRIDKIAELPGIIAGINSKVDEKIEAADCAGCA